MIDSIIQYQSNSVAHTMHAYWPVDERWVLSSSLTEAQSSHATMLQHMYGTYPSAPLSIIWVESPKPTTESIKREELSDAAIQQYKLLGDRLAEIAAMEKPPVEVGAVLSADKVLKDLAHYKVQPPEITWHGGDAIAMLWRLGMTSYAITITEGELGYVVRAERKTLRRDYSIPLEDIGILVAH